VRALAQRTYQTKLTAHRSTKIERPSGALNVAVSSVAEDGAAGELTFGNADHAGERIISLLAVFVSQFECQLGVNGTFSWNFRLGLKMKCVDPAPRGGWRVGLQIVPSTRSASATVSDERRSKRLPKRSTASWHELRRDTVVRPPRWLPW
jgi:hypothetical protein